MITKFSEWVDLFTHGAPLARSARGAPLLLMSFYWILANAFHIWSTLDGYEKLAGEFEAISNGLKHENAYSINHHGCLLNF